MAHTSMKYKACVFDLDGTLLNTLPDLARLTNQVLAKRGYPTYTTEQIRSFVGNGGHALMRQAVPSTEPEENVESALEEWRELYVTEGTSLTEPYPNIVEVLTTLHRKGVLLGVLSNKFLEGVTVLVGEKLPPIFDEVRGESDTCPRKPNPACLLDMIDSFGVDASEVLYVGDSGGDMATARAAGAYAVGVSWGYQPVSQLWEKGAHIVIDDPTEILALVESL